MWEHYSISSKVGIELAKGGGVEHHCIPFVRCSPHGPYSGYDCKIEHNRIFFGVCNPHNLSIY